MVRSHEGEVMLHDHNCSTCKAAGDCDLEAILLSTREALRCGGVPGLVGLVTGKMKKPDKGQDRYNWLAAGAEVIGPENGTDLQAYSSGVRLATSLKRQAELEGMFRHMAMAMGSLMMARAVETINGLAARLGVVEGVVQMQGFEEDFEGNAPSPGTLQ